MKKVKKEVQQKRKSKFYVLKGLKKKALVSKVYDIKSNNAALGMKFTRITPKSLMGFYAHLGTFRYYRNALLDRYSLYFRNQHLIVNTKLTSMNLKQAFWLIFKTYARTYFSFIKKVRGKKKNSRFQQVWFKRKKRFVSRKALALFAKQRVRRKLRSRFIKKYLSDDRKVVKAHKFRDLCFENSKFREDFYKLTKIYVVNAFEGISESLNLEFNKKEKKKFVDFRLNMHELSDDKYVELLRGKLIRQIRIKKKLTKEQKDENKERELKELRRRENEPADYRKLVSWFKLYGPSYGFHYKSTWMKGFMTNRPKNLWRREPVNYYPLPSLVIVIYSEKYLDIANEAIRCGIPSIGLVTTEMEPVFMYNLVVGQLNVEFVRFFLHLLKETVLMAKFYNKYIVRYLKYQNERSITRQYFKKFRRNRRRVYRYVDVWKSFKEKREFNHKQRRFITRKFGEKQLWSV